MLLMKMQMLLIRKYLSLDELDLDALSQSRLLEQQGGSLEDTFRQAISATAVNLSKDCYLACHYALSSMWGVVFSIIFRYYQDRPAFIIMGVIAAASALLSPFIVIQGQSAIFCNCADRARMRLEKARGRALSRGDSFQDDDAKDNKNVHCEGDQKVASTALDESEMMIAEN